MRQHASCSSPVTQARQAQLAFQLSSLDAPLGDPTAMSTLADALGAEDPQLERMISMHAVAAHWGELPPREQQILIMDFHDDMTQAQIGLRLRISQMHVSRLRAHALGHLRTRLLGSEPRPVQGPARRQHPGHLTMAKQQVQNLPPVDIDHSDLMRAANGSQNIFFPASADTLIAGGLSR